MESGVVFGLVGSLLGLAGIIATVIIGVLSSIQVRNLGEEIGTLKQLLREGESNIPEKITRFMQENPQSSPQEVAKEVGEWVHTIYEPYVTTGGIRKGGVGILTTVDYAEGDEKENP